MMKKIKIGICLLGILYVFYQSAPQALKIMDWIQTNYYVIENGISEDTALKICAARDSQDIVFWKTREVSIVSNEKIPNKEKVELITICGNPEILVSNFTVPQFGHTSGCLIDKNTSEKLFGTYNSTGLKINVDFKEYTIQGILEIPQKVVMIQADKDYKDGFNRVTLSNDNAGDILQKEVILQNKYGLVLQKSNWRILFWGIKVLLFCCIMLIYRNVRNEISNLLKLNDRKEIFKTVYSFISIGIIPFVSFWGICIRGLNVAYFPSEWSDMSFYSTIVDRFFMETRNLILQSLSVFEVNYIFDVARLSLDILLVNLLIIYVIHGIWHENATMSKTD